MNSTSCSYCLGIHLKIAKLQQRQQESKLKSTKKKAAQLETKNQKDMLVKSDSADAFQKYWATDGKSVLSSKDTKQS